MRVAIALFAMTICLSSFGQCPQVVKTFSDVATFVKKAEAHLRVELVLAKHQPNTNYIWRDTSGRTWIKVSATDTSAVDVVTLRGGKNSMERLLTEVYSRFPTDCVIEKRAKFFRTKNIEITVREEEWNPKITSDQPVTVTISNRRDSGK